jgi:hypothetical protein
MRLSKQLGCHSDRTCAEDAAAFANLYVALVCCMESYRKRLDQGAFLCGNINRKLKSIICWELNKPFFAAPYRRCCKELAIRVEIIFSGFAKFAGAVRYVRFKTYPIADFNIRNTFANFNDYSGSLMSEHIILDKIHLVGSYLSVVIILYVGTINTDVYSRESTADPLSTVDFGISFMIILSLPRMKAPFIISH